MQDRLAVLACGACLVVGAATGAILGRLDDRDESSSAASGAPTPSRDDPPHPASASLDDDRERRPSTERDPAAGHGSLREDPPRRLRQKPYDRTVSADPPPPAESPRGEPAEDPDVEAPEDEVERLRQELDALREERREVMGEPVSPPADLEPRFGGAVMSGSVQNALAEANVPGAVEATDCSEHPCIVFGRLEGDEEDMEEVERAAALSTYDGDVLTLLFWATSVEEPGAKPAETGLFALAFYSFEDRAGQGDALDRRIRARTMEYWNHDRPGRGAAE